MSSYVGGSGSELEHSTNSGFGYIYQGYNRNKKKVRVSSDRAWFLAICSIGGLTYQLKFTHNYSLLSASKDFNQHATLSTFAKDRTWAVTVFLLTQKLRTLLWPNAYFGSFPSLFLSHLFFFILFLTLILQTTDQDTYLKTPEYRCCKLFTCNSNKQDKVRNKQAEEEKLLFNLKSKQWVLIALSWARLPCPCHHKNFGYGRGLLPSV